MAGSISLSISQQFDELGVPLAGGQLFFIEAGTTSTPQNAFQDSALTIPWPNPLTLDAAGRVPQLYFADGLIKIRLEDKNGVTQVVADNILVVGPSSGSGGGGSVDPTTILATGDMKLVYGTGVVTGFVRANGRTIGSSTSGASERANLDTQALFQYLWGADPNLVVSTGRGVSAAADWSANKQITLPDARNRGLAGLGDMGNSDAALFAGTTFTSGGSTTLGSTLGVGTPKSLLRSDLPNASVTVNIHDPGHNHPLPATFLSDPSNAPQGGSGGGTNFKTGFSGTATTGITADFQLNGNVGQTTFNTVSPLILITCYLKL